MMISSFIHGFFLGSILLLVALACLMIGWIAADFFRDFHQRYEKNRLPDNQETDATPDPDGD